jgi:N-6 DNA Methylase
VREGLLRVGFSSDRLRSGVHFPDGTSKPGLLAFSDRPLDSRTAALVALVGPRFLEADISSARPLGAPVVFACLPDRYQVWKQAAEQPRFFCQLKPSEVAGFFTKHASELAPQAIYRAKTWARLETNYQLEFVDVGLLPVVEEEAGEKLRKVVERVVDSTRSRLGWSQVSDRDGRWLLQATFWLLAAKILQDKEVPGFAQLALTDLDSVYERLAKHYNSSDPRPVPVGGRERRAALEAAAVEIGGLGHCGLVSTEALAHLYESALIDRATRQRLGTHSTPPWLVDYIVGRLRPWVEELPPKERDVFEPACGHAAFLISAMRLLSELLPSDWPEPRRSYLRHRLHGMEYDSFALEIARLSLTLADVPNPNGWALTEADMFPGDRLERSVRQASIVLGNPPFEPFGAASRKEDWLHNKAAETFRRVVEDLRSGGMFGFVLPQTLLHNRQAQPLREVLLRDYEISEISLFADKVFRYGEPESAVVIGRRLMPNRPRHFAVRYQRIREGQVAEFSRTYAASSEMAVARERLIAGGDASLLVPELDDLWQSLSGKRRLAEFVDIGKGFDHIGDDDPLLPKGTVKVSEEPRPGMVPGFALWSEDQMTHRLPRIMWLNLAPALISSPRRGTTIGVPQVVLNYARVSRGVWRLKAMIDEKGHPANSNFSLARPRSHRLPLAVLWGILNSPLANAYTYCLSAKRHVLVGDLGDMRVPDLESCALGPLEKSVSDYLAAAQATPSVKRQPIGSGAQRSNAFRQIDFFKGEGEQALSEAESERLKFLHWRVDAEVLGLYNLPAKLERRLLDLFGGVRRRGVPFLQMEYFPKGYTDLNRLSDLLAITVDWKKNNRRRGKLIDLEGEGRLTPAQVEELANLQRLADALVGLMQPWKPDEVDRAVERAKQRGVWQE